MLSGFTIRGGTTLLGGGIHIESSSPTIRGNVITGNRCGGGGRRSQLRVAPDPGKSHHAQRDCRARRLGHRRITSAAPSRPSSSDNEISENTGTSANGGGISLFNAGNLIIRNNVITRNASANHAGCGAGGGIESYGSSQATIAGNLIVGNSACAAAGSTGGLDRQQRVRQQHDRQQRRGVLARDVRHGFDAGDELHNNIITAQTGPASIARTLRVSSPTLSSNDIFSAQGAPYGGTCADQTGLNGNISADPAFLGAANRDYRVAMTSPVVDTGNDGAPVLPATDLAGFARVFDGNGDGVARVDIGAFESRNHAPVVNAGADRTITADAGCRGQVALSAVASDVDGDSLRLTWSGAVRHRLRSESLTDASGGHTRNHGDGRRRHRRARVRHGRRHNRGYHSASNHGRQGQSVGD